jgi:glycosyltransferase involved in cell wall biosynthesis
MTRIRVALLVSNLAIDGPGGGIGRFVDELSRALNPELLEISLYALWRFNLAAEQVVSQRLRAAGVDSQFAADWDETHPYRGFWRSARGLKRLLAASPVDIIHSHHEFADVAALLTSRTARARAVMRTVHNEEWKLRPVRRVLFTNGWYPLAFRLEAGVSQAIADRLNRRPLARILRRRAVVLHNAINLDRFKLRGVDRQEARRRLGVPAAAPLVGSIGRLTEQKGFGYFVEAAAQLRARWPEAHFVLIGSGEQGAALQDKAARLGLAEHLHWAGSQPDVERWLPGLDVFVSSSLWEGLPTVIMESMASGVPVVATDVLGTRELIQDGATGRLVPPGDAPALAAAISQMLSDAAQRAQFAARALQAVELFSIQAVAAQHERLYEALARGPLLEHNADIAGVGDRAGG